MKNLILLFSLSLVSICSGQTISTYGETFNNSFGESVFLDLSSFNAGGPSDARGLTFARTDLSVFTFNTQVGDGFSTFLTGYDGTIIFNTATGTTPATGSGIGGQAVVPGFYYFSNPGSDGDSTTGSWLPVGGQSATVKSKEVTVVVPANPTTATLDLGTSVIAASEVNSFLGAKIYDNSGNLVMTADSAYNKSTNLLTTGNGIMYQVLPAGTYKVVVDYK
jgi:hypothetical protein